MSKYNEVIGSVAEAMFMCAGSTISLEVIYSDTRDGCKEILMDAPLNIVFKNDAFDSKNLENVIAQLVGYDCHGYEVEQYKLNVIEDDQCSFVDMQDELLSELGA